MPARTAPPPPATRPVAPVPPSSAPPETPLLASGFILGAALVLTWSNPIYWDLAPRPTETVGAVLLAGALVGWGTFRGPRGLLFVGVAALLGLSAWGLTSQPVPLGTQDTAGWPLRAALVGGMFGIWAFLMEPPRWLRWGLVAAAVPTVALLLLAGSPLAAAMTASHPVAQGPHYNPYWLALDSTGTLYAGNAGGNFIGVFDAAGTPRGRLWPPVAPDATMDTVGILPIGYDSPVPLTGRAAGPTPTPAPVETERANYSFCGLAVGPGDALYLINTLGGAPPAVFGFDRAGRIATRWPLPAGYSSSVGCLAADASHVYVSSGTQHIYIYDGAGTLQRTVALDFQPYGLAVASPDTLLVLGHNFLYHLPLNGGTGVQTPLPPVAGPIQTPYQTLAALPGGQVLVTDLNRRRVLVVDGQTGALLRTIGEPGAWPGQLGGLGGVAADPAGRVYVADSRQGAVQRFTPAGQVDAVWWAPAPAAGVTNFLWPLGR
jgi:DNA-binding beta-propeller fold protein YncE